MGSRITYRANGHETPGYLALPERSGPGVVVIQEWWGLVPHIERIADRFAEEGFVALAPDLYHGERAATPDQAGKMMMALRIEEAAKDITGAVDRNGKEAKRTGGIGVVGFCMGGALALYAASRSPKIGACVVFYGGHPHVKPDLTALSAPVLGIYAGKDGFDTPDVVKQLDKDLTALGKPHEFHTYADADHAFFNDTRPEV